MTRRPELYASHASCRLNNALRILKAVSMCMCVTSNVSKVDAAAGY